MFYFYHSLKQNEPYISKTCQRCIFFVLLSPYPSRPTEKNDKQTVQPLALRLESAVFVHDYNKHAVVKMSSTIINA